MPSISERRDAVLRNLRSPADIDPAPEVQGVLLSDEIKFYAEHLQLISPFVFENLKPAAYELTLGDEYFISGQFLSLETAKNQKASVTIPPFEVAVLKTSEIICLPRYLIARWNIRVKHAYLGLLWVGGPQVDPGYAGHLYCPIYNLSARPVTLQQGEAIAVIDFTKTSAFDPTKERDELVRYPYPPKRVVMEDYDIGGLQSALFTTAGRKLVEFDEEIRNMGTRFTTYTQISFGIFALVIALVGGVLTKVTDHLPIDTNMWAPLAIGVSFWALLVAWFSGLRPRIGRLVFEQYGHVMGSRMERAQHLLKKWWIIGIIVSMLPGILGGGLMYFFVRSATKNATTAAATLGDLQNLKQQLEQQIQTLPTTTRQ